MEETPIESTKDQLQAATDMVNSYVRRITHLHSEIKKRDNCIEEMEQELAAKDEIIRKLTIKLSEHRAL